VWLRLCGGHWGWSRAGVVGVPPLCGLVFVFWRWFLVTVLGRVFLCRVVSRRVKSHPAQALLVS